MRHRGEAHTMASLTDRNRRRPFHLPFFPTVALLLVAGGSLLGSSGAVSSTTLNDPLVSLDTATLTSNMRHWTKDYAVMFYAPWCKHCKEDFLPLWEGVSKQLAHKDPKGKRKLVMGKFNCEQDTAAAQFCQDVRLEYYPTFMFFGAGKFHDHDPLSGAILGPRPTEHESTAKFPSGAMVYHEVMADWAETMHLISSSNRVMEKINIFRWGRGRGKEKASEQEQLIAEIEALERKAQHLEQTMARAGGAEAAVQEASSLPYGYGDPYRELMEVGYDPEFEPVMQCVIDMAGQYCEAEGIKELDPWCSILDSCVATDFQGAECWPSSCPLLDEGCQITSFCLAPELVELYIDLHTKHLEDNKGLAGGEARELGIRPEGGLAEAAEQSGEQPAVQSGEAATLPPFFGRRHGAGAGGVDRTGDERGETVAA